MGPVHTAESAFQAMHTGAHAVWVHMDEVDRLQLPGGWMVVDKAQIVAGELAMCLRNPALQDAIKRYENGEPVTVLEALYAESRLSL
jgi:hypothetical protein